MVETVLDKIKRSLDAAEQSYNRLVLIVGDSGSGKTFALRKAAEDAGTTVVNVSLELSNKLLELSPRQRTLSLPKILDQITDGTKSPLFLDNLEILFDKELKLDPLRLLQSISRNRTVVASWTGKSTPEKLQYAEAGHPEFRSYELSETLVVGMDGTSTIDMEKCINGTI